MRRLLLITFAFLSIASAVHAQSPRLPDQYTRVLLPFHASVGTPVGSWFVQWWFRNDGEAPADVFPLALPCGLPPPPGPEGRTVFMAGRPSLPPMTTRSCLAGDVLPSFAVPPVVPVVSDAPGAFVHVETAALGDVIVSGTVRWSTGPATSAGAAELRGIPEGAFLAGRGSIMPIPVVTDRRHAIRVYALPETIGASARAEVRVYELQAPPGFSSREELVSTIPIELRIPAHRLLPCFGACDIPAVSYVPASAEAFDLVVGGPTRSRPSTLRIEIVPESPALRWWAVVSATDNKSHELHLYQPALIAFVRR